MGRPRRSSAAVRQPRPWLWPNASTHVIMSAPRDGALLCPRNHRGLSRTGTPLPSSLGMAIFRGLRLRGGRSEKSKPARDEQSGANAFANPLTKPGYFDGHTPAEAWLFMLNAVWMPLPLLLRLWPATFNWLPRVGAVSSLPSWLACASHCASIAHWSAYRPGSIAQHVDIILAGALMLASAHSPRAPPGEKIAPSYCHNRARTLPSLSHAMLVLRVFLGSTQGSVGAHAGGHFRGGARGGAAAAVAMFFDVRPRLP